VPRPTSRSGAPADIIVTRVDSPANTLAITTRDLVTLRHAGVPESVLTAMRAHIPASPATVPLQPDDARLVDLVHLIGTGISESIISEQVRQSDQTYVFSVNDIRYLEEHGAGDRTIAALMATRAGRPAAPAVAPSELVFDDLELVNEGFWRRDREGRLVMRGDTLRWEGSHGSRRNFEFQILKGDIHRFRDLHRESGSTSEADDRFTARVVEPVLVNGEIAIAAGSIVSGRVISVHPSRKLGGRAQIDLEFTSLELASGGGGPILASFHGQGESQDKKDAVTIGGSAAAGALLGRILGSDSGDTVLGALVGGAIGTGIAARTRGQEVTLPAGTTMEIHLDSPFKAA
jgi:hypothetical protein